MHMNFEPWAKKYHFHTMISQKEYCIQENIRLLIFALAFLNWWNFHFQVFKIETQQFLAKVRRN